MPRQNSAGVCRNADGRAILSSASAAWSASLNDAGHRTRIGRFGGSRHCLEVLRAYTGWPPRYFIDRDISANTLESGRWLDHTSGCQRRIGAFQFLKSGFTDENAATPGKAFETAGQVHFPAKHRIIF